MYLKNMKKKKSSNKEVEVEVVDFATKYAKMVQYEQNRMKTSIPSPSKGEVRVPPYMRQQRQRQPQRSANVNMNMGYGVAGASGSASASASGFTHGLGVGSGSLELRDLRKEVETLGASGLDRKSAKEWQGRNLVRNLGYTKLDKKPKMSAKIGLGIRKKKIEREVKARELARETGMLVRPPKKGKGKSARFQNSNKKKGGFSARGKKTSKIRPSKK